MANNEVAIVGAGLNGLVLSLALHQQSIPCTIYEARAESLNIGGAIMLSPNALKILDTLKVYERVKPKGYNFELLYFRSADDKPLDTLEFGGKEKYGYEALRIYRHELITELLKMLEECSIPVHYGKKIVKIVEETHAGVTFEFADNTQQSAAFLVGADGIHSTVRKYLYPDLEPEFQNAMSVTAAVPRSQLKGLDNDYSLPVTILNKEHGAFVIAPQLVDGSEILLGKQRRTEALDRQGWSKLMADKQWCVEFLSEGAEDYPQIVRNAVSNIPHNRVNLWPYYVVPKLDTWVSKACRVIILGDAAHAIPPTAGQGINQGFEDTYTFARILKICQKNESIAATVEALRKWEDYRQERVDHVLELNAQIDRRRMPRNDEEAADTKHFDLAWLYTVDFDAIVKSWSA